MYVVTKKPGEGAKIVEFAKKCVSLEDIKDAVDQAWVTMTTVRINGFTFDIWCDDEGLLKELPLNFYHTDIHQPIVGPVIVCAHDADGDSIPLTKKQADAIAAWLDV